MHIACRGFQVLQENWFAIATTVGAIGLAIDKWVHRRELKEIMLTNQQRESDAKQENLRLLSALKHDSDRDRMAERLANLLDEIRRLHDKASENHGETQKRMGDMELKVASFMSKSETQMKEIYRVIGRRETDDAAPAHA